MIFLLKKNDYQNDKSLNSSLYRGMHLLHEKNLKHLIIIVKTLCSVNLNQIILFIKTQVTVTLC